jgi:hypothetical protein
LGKLLTELSKLKSPPSDAEIVELKPPAEFGFSGTVKYYRVADAATIALLQARGYMVVDPQEPAA